MSAVEDTEADPTSISQAVAASGYKPRLVQSITKYNDGQNVSEHLIDYNDLKRSHPLTFPTVIVINVDKRTSIVPTFNMTQLLFSLAPDDLMVRYL